MSYTIEANCLKCKLKLVPVRAPQGHEDHAHLRCKKCNPANFAICLRIILHSS